MDRLVPLALFGPLGGSFNLNAHLSANVNVEARRTAGVLLLLSGATAVSWWLGIERVMTSRRMATVTILAIALIKVRLVIRYFMNVRTAPGILKIACDIWIVGLGAALVALYWTEKT